MKSWKEQFAESTNRRSAEVAHDLKTPLNVAVLNLELARMKLRKVTETDDGESIPGYLKSVEGELRRIARIFDAYFVYVVPPSDEPPPLTPLMRVVEEVASDHRIEVAADGPDIEVRIHPERLRVLVSNLVAGWLAVLVDPVAELVTADGVVRLVARGKLQRNDEELSKIFKFYYTDASGAPALGLATARLIAETYGATLESRSEDGGVAIELKFPAGVE